MLDVYDLTVIPRIPSCDSYSQKGCQAGGHSSRLRFNILSGNPLVIFSKETCGKFPDVLVVTKKLYIFLSLTKSFLYLNLTRL